MSEYYSRYYIILYSIVEYSILWCCSVDCVRSLMLVMGCAARLGAQLVWVRSSFVKYVICYSYGVSIFNAISSVITRIYTISIYNIIIRYLGLLQIRTSS